MIDTVPTTTVVTKQPAPKSSPSAMAVPRPGSGVFMSDEYTLKMSGAPLPKARNVTPATLWDSFSESAITVSTGQKNSSAVMPSAMKSTTIHATSSTHAPGTLPCSTQKGRVK
jgi:hypothetical protein